MEPSYEKEKNLIKMEIKQGKIYTFDINTCRFIGIKGNPIKTTPPGLHNFIYSISDWHLGAKEKENAGSNVISTIFFLKDREILPNYQLLTNFVDIIRVADKLESIGYFVQRRDISSYNLYERFAYLESHLKDFLEYLEEEGENEKNTIDFYDNKRFELWLKNNNIKIDEDYLPSRMAREVFNYIDNEGKNCYIAKNLNRTFYYLTKGFYQQSKAFSIRGVDAIEEYFEIVDVLGLEIEKGDFFKAYTKAKREEERNRQAIDKLRFSNAQLKNEKALSFENEDFIVVIPTIPEELIKEGRENSNCVGSYCNNVINYYKNVVFIRRKDDPEKAYITCDIYTSSGKINQYLLKGNTKPIGAKELRFQEQYQAHLLENW